MDITNWLTENGMTQTDLSRLLKVSHPAVSYWCNGLTRPSPKMAKTIAQLTKGQLTANDFQRAWEKRQ